MLQQILIIYCPLTCNYYLYSIMQIIILIQVKTIRC